MPFLIRFMFLVRIAYSPNDIMITILREPVARYLSEWKHVTRGARLGFKGTALLTLLFCCGNILILVFHKLDEIGNNANIGIR